MGAPSRDLCAFSNPDANRSQFLSVDGDFFSRHLEGWVQHEVINAAGRVGENCNQHTVKITQEKKPKYKSRYSKEFLKPKQKPRIRLMAYQIIKGV